MKIMTIAALALVATTAAASAQGYAANRIDSREARQEHRIDQGRRTGQLTRHELLHLEAQQARIRQMQRQAMRDGRVDRHEAGAIERAQNTAGRRIAHERHDHQRRGLWHRRWW